MLIGGWFAERTGSNFFGLILAFPFMLIWALFIGYAFLSVAFEVFPDLLIGQMAVCLIGACFYLFLFFWMQEHRLESTDE